MFGPWAASTAILLGAVGWLVKQLRAERARSDQLSAELLALSERALPALTESSSALRESAAMLRAQQGMLGRYDVLLHDAERRRES